MRVDRRTALVLPTLVRIRTLDARFASAQTGGAPVGRQPTVSWIPRAQDETLYMNIFSAGARTPRRNCSISRPARIGSYLRGRNALGWERRLRLDEWYVDHVSLALDCWILCKTVTAVVAGRGVTELGHSTVTDFQGTDQGSPRAR
jgi:Bacterial sugar transferase